MPWFVICLGVLVGLVISKLIGVLTCSWWLVLTPIPVYFGVQVLLGVAFCVYLSGIGRRP